MRTYNRKDGFPIYKRDNFPVKLKPMELKSMTKEDALLR